MCILWSQIYPIHVVWGVLNEFHMITYRYVAQTIGEGKPLESASPGMEPPGYGQTNI